MRPNLVRRTLVTTAALGLALATAPTVAHAEPTPHTNAPVKVKLTVQGPDGVLFKGKIKTKGHDVTTVTGGTHKCDGTNGGANPSAVPTPTAALDDAAKKKHFTWDGSNWPPRRRCCFSTSRPAAWTTAPRANSSASWTASPPKAGPS